MGKMAQNNPTLWIALEAKVKAQIHQISLPGEAMLLVELPQVEILLKVEPLHQQQRRQQWQQLLDILGEQLEKTATMVTLMHLALEMLQHLQGVVIHRLVVEEEPLAQEAQEEMLLVLELTLEEAPQFLLGVELLLLEEEQMQQEVEEEQMQQEVEDHQLEVQLEMQLAGHLQVLLIRPLQEQVPIQIQAIRVLALLGVTQRVQETLLTAPMPHQTLLHPLVVLEDLAQTLQALEIKMQA